MKKLIIILLSLSILGCSNSQKEDTNSLKIALINGINTTFVETLNRDIIEYAQNNYPNIQIIDKNISGDIIQQQSQIESLITQGIDGIIIQIANTAIAQTIDNYVKNNNTPTLYFNIRPTTLKDGSYNYVGMDERSIGFLQVQEVLKVRSNGNAVILSGDYNNEATKLRTKGILENVSNTQINILDEKSADWYDNKAENIMERWINLGFNIDIVFSNNDDMAVGAIRALEKANKKFGTNEGEVLVIGVDATDNGLAQIKAGNMYATIKQDSKLEAKIIVDTIADAIKNNTSPRTILVTPEVVNK